MTRAELLSAVDAAHRALSESCERLRVAEATGDAATAEYERLRIRERFHVLKFAVAAAEAV